MTNSYILRDQEIGIDSVQPHPDNYNLHPPDQIEGLMQSLVDFRQIGSIVVKGPYIYAGNGLWEAAKRLGWETIRADVLTDEYPSD